LNKNTLYLSHEWQNKPGNVHAYTTLHTNHVSNDNSNASHYGGFNLATHVGDNQQVVESNRLQLITDLDLPSPPVWLDQIHSNKVICADRQTHVQQTIAQADAAFSNDKKVVCAVLTADCLPVFFCNRAGNKIAVAHAGWRGLHVGVLRKTVESMKTSASEILAYLGPAIGPQSFEVGDDVFHVFAKKNNANKVAFTPSKKGHYLCDIYQLARIELQSIGVNLIEGGGWCSYTDNRFYSYRRQKVTGRMASLIWLE